MMGLLLSACTVPGDASSFDWDPYYPPAADTCEVAQKVFLPYCTTCHNGTVNALDLQPDKLAGLANMVSPAYAPALLVVPGDRQASLLYRKATSPGPDDGLLMPLSGAMPAEAIEALGAWIDAGAPACEGSEVPLVNPGGPLYFGGPPSHFTSEKPASAPSGECSSAHWWAGGNTETPHMRPGWDCIDCHAREDGPDFDFAGTVHASLTDPDDCRGVPGVTVELLDLNDQVFAKTTTNLAGNFFFEEVGGREFRARLTYQGRTREMATHQGYGGCNSCHSPSGDGGAPGRIVAP
jgi:hypothetical protein